MAMKRTRFDYDDLLPFPLKTVPHPKGALRIYEIPDSAKEAVLKKLYIFRPVPSLDAEMEDIHEEKKFRVRDFIVVREGRMNVLASPYFPESGGTVIDWWPLDEEEEGGVFDI
jgi:hypothetical protein